MAKPPHDHAFARSNTYFVTASAFERQALFPSERTAKLLIETIFEYREQGKYLLHEFVVMPNHIHLLFSPVATVTLERTTQFIKGGYSYRVGKQLGTASGIWQRGYVDHRIRIAQDYFIHSEYIRLNPVRAHLVDAAEDHPFRSAHLGFGLDVIPQGLQPFS